MSPSPPKRENFPFLLRGEGGIILPPPYEGESSLPLRRERGDNHFSSLEGEGLLRRRRGRILLRIKKVNPSSSCGGAGGEILPPP